MDRKAKQRKATVYRAVAHSSIMPGMLVPLAAFGTGLAIPIATPDFEWRLLPIFRNKYFFPTQNPYSLR